MRTPFMRNSFIYQLENKKCLALIGYIPRKIKFYLFNTALGLMERLIKHFYFKIGKSPGFDF